MDSVRVECIVAVRVFDCSHVKWLSVSFEILLYEDFIAFLCVEFCASFVDVGKLCVPLAPVMCVNVVNN